MRGEYWLYLLLDVANKGSPPLARGVPIISVALFAGRRITPACAGSTLYHLFSFSFSKDHPRLRGEYSLTMLQKETIIGSPPLARGVLRKMLKERKLSRITPACAGSTNFICHPVSPFRDHPRLRGEYRWYSRRQAVRQDHPRLRGEYFRYVVHCYVPPGSPPLARGVLIACHCINNATRITPACAGSTRVGISQNKALWDHPRLRGEYFV